MKNLYRELLNLLYLLIPATALILALSSPLVEILFQRGQFDERSTHLVNIALIGLAVSLITSLPREIYTRAFYAIGDSKTPFIVSAISIFWNAILDWLLVTKFQVAGIAMSTTLTALINSLLLIILFHRKFDSWLNFEWLKTIQYIFVGVFCYLIANTTFNFLSRKELLPLPELNFINLNTVIYFVLASFSGLAFYIAVTFVSKKLLK